tara:strand:+ start:525 stop:704 length:180 start_codon:yes stop_codon:yes gene_type:complete
MNYSEIIEAEKRLIKRDLWLLAISSIVAMAVVWLTLNISSEPPPELNTESTQSVEGSIE